MNVDFDLMIDESEVCVVCQQEEEDSRETQQGSLQLKLKWPTKSFVIQLQYFIAMSAFHTFNYYYIFIL